MPIMAAFFSRRSVCFLIRNLAFLAFNKTPLCCTKRLNRRIKLPTDSFGFLFTSTILISSFHHNLPTALLGLWPVSMLLTDSFVKISASPSPYVYMAKENARFCLGLGQVGYVLIFYLIYEHLSNLLLHDFRSEIFTTEQMNVQMWNKFAAMLAFIDD